jgi:hypothetical protein
MGGISCCVCSPIVVVLCEDGRGGPFICGSDPLPFRWWGKAARLLLSLYEPQPIAGQRPLSLMA